MTASRPRGIALRQLLMDFFAACPDEELTLAMIQGKFGCSYSAARCATRELREEELLEAEYVIRLRTRGIAAKPDERRHVAEYLSLRRTT